MYGGLLIAMEEMHDLMVGNGWQQVERSANTFRFKKGSFTVDIVLKGDDWNVEFGHHKICYSLDNYQDIPGWIDRMSTRPSSSRGRRSGFDMVQPLIDHAGGRAAFGRLVDDKISDVRENAKTRSGSPIGTPANLITECIQGLASRVAFLESNHF